MAEVRNLVIARCGRNSLHPHWIDPSAPRDFDLHLVPFEPLPAELGRDCTVGEVIPGPKWSGLRDALKGWDGWREYDYVWLPDDDLQATAETISAMFGVARSLGFDLFAPALHESSHYAHFITMRNLSVYGRWVGFVEIMAPGFSRPALEELLPTLDLTVTGWGWGLDSVWPKLLDYRNVGVIDGLPVVHTRPVGQMRDQELAVRIHAESDAMLAHHDARQTHVTFAAFGPDLKRLDLSPEALLAQLARGWEYLWQRDPRVLYWLAHYQMPHFSWPDYPTAGTP